MVTCLNMWCRKPGTSTSSSPYTAMRMLCRDLRVHLHRTLVEDLARVPLALASFLVYILGKASKGSPQLKIWKLSNKEETGMSWVKEQAHGDYPFRRISALCNYMKKKPIAIAWSYVSPCIPTFFCHMQYAICYMLYFSCIFFKK